MPRAAFHVSYGRALLSITKMGALSFVSYPWEWPSQLSTWAYEKLTLLTLNVLAAGPLPQHIGFVMDGNRRYARQGGKPVQEGHADGFVSLQRILECCLRLRVRCVTVFAFSIENFNRSEDEVQALMDLFKTKMVEISQQGQMLDQYGVRLNIVGQTGHLPEDVQEAVRRVENMTRGNDRAILNICMPYTSRDEMTTAIQSVVADYKAGELSPDDITTDELDARLPLSQVGSPPLDILVRTSGVTRLSDFLLWQCVDTTQIQYTPVYWPAFGLRDLVPILLDYQLKAWAGGMPRKS